jgi:putative salt-induced outer membrane protein YdiY
MKVTRLFYGLVMSASLLFGAIQARSEDAPPASQPATKWQSTAAAGLTLTRGNSENLMATLSAATGRKWEQNELALGVDAAYGKNTDQKTDVTTRTSDTYHGFGQYNRLFTERLFGYFRADGLYDSVADIHYRVTLSPGLGYYFIKEKATHLSAELGPSYVLQKLGNEETSFATLRVGEKFDRRLSEHARLWQSAEWLPKVDDFHNYVINAEIGVEADLTQDKRLSMRTFLQDTYNSRPATGRKNNDAKLVAGIAYKF